MESDSEFVADMEWLHSHDREAALPPDKLTRLFVLARKCAEAAARIEALEAALRDLLDASERHIFSTECQVERDAARAALEDKV